MSSVTRRTFTKGALMGASAAALGLWPGRAAAEYPLSRIEALIPFSPGGGTDRSVRVVSPTWGAILGSGDFRLNHMPGAGSLIAQNGLAAGPHDGSKLLFSPAPHVAWLDELQSDRFSAEQVAWIGSYFQDPNVLLVPNDAPYANVEEFLDAAANSDQPFTASVSSPMSAAHAATVILRERAGINIRVVPFDGGSAARNAVAGGHVDCCMAPYWSALHVQELTRALCIFWPEDPTTGLWDAPPASEVLPFDMPNLHEPYGVLVSAEARDNHPDRFEMLKSTFMEVFDAESFQTAAAQQNLTPFVNAWDGAQCEAFIAEYLAVLASIRGSMEQDVREM